MNESPTSMDTSGKTNYRRKALVTVGFIAVLWASMLVGDWFMRFYWFGWHRDFVRQKERMVSSAVPGAQTNAVASRRGGDLSQLIGIEAVARKYEQVRPTYQETRDAFGFRNALPSAAYYPIVVVGDSYMKTGAPMTNMFGARLSRKSGLPVYNYVEAGRGPIWAMQAFFETERFRGKYPEVLVWGLVEREIHSRMLAGSLIYDLWVKEHPEEQERHIGKVSVRLPSVLNHFKPRSLKRVLPNTSAIAQVSRRVWNLFRFYAFGLLNPQVIPAATSVNGQPVLFYGESLNAMRWGNASRDIDKVVWAIDYLADFCDRKGIALVVVLIPDKAQVYRDRLPQTVTAGREPVPESCLWALEAGLASNAVSVVNLLGPFRQKAEEDELLYWADDTHWNTQGIALAAELTWERIRELED